MFKRKQKNDPPDEVFSPQFEGQHADEVIAHVFRRHPVVMRKGLIAVLIGVLIGMVPSTVNPSDLRMLWGIPIGFAVGFFFLFIKWLGWYYSVFIVTDQRFIRITQRGLFKRSVIDLGLDKIQNVNYQVNGMQQTMLKFGTVVVQTFVGDLVLENMPHPEDIQQQIVKSIKDHSERHTSTEEESEKEENQQE